MESSNKYLGEVKISKLLLKFSIPCIMGLLISALYNIVDQIFIGNSELGFYGNAATGVSFPIICIANAFAWCIGDGAAYYRNITGQKWGDPSNYTLSIDSLLGIDNCVEQICKLYED